VKFKTKRLSLLKLGIQVCEHSEFWSKTYAGTQITFQQSPCYQGCEVGGKISDSVSNLSKTSDSDSRRQLLKHEENEIRLDGNRGGNRGAQQETSVSTKV